jgi:LysM repeat protein
VVATLALTGSAATGSYTVREGDTVSEIASRTGVSARGIVAANGLTDPDRVIAGRTLTIPGTASPAGAPTSAYTVRPGDTVSHIALRTGVPARAIVDANALPDADRLAVGRTLSIPGGGGSGSTASTGGGAPAAAGYTVREGDTLSGIASRLGVSTGALARANGIGDADRVVIGRTLTVPAAASTATGTAPPGLPARLRASPQRLAYVPVFDRWAAQYGVPADLLKAMTWVESGWQQGAVSSTGAVGIGQIMPDTHAWMRDVIIREPLDPTDPNDNIRMSARYLRWLLDRTGGDVRLALAGYYQGLHAVNTRGVLAETERYVANIVAYRDRHF